MQKVCTQSELPVDITRPGMESVIFRCFVREFDCSMVHAHNSNLML